MAIASYGLFAAMVLMASNGFFSAPPSEIVLPLAGALLASDVDGLIFIVIIISFANLIGTYLLFILGGKVGMGFVPKARIAIAKCKYKIISPLHKLLPNKIILSVLCDRFLIKGYLWVAIFRCLPVVRSIISFPAGALKMNHAGFLVASFTGILVWESIWISLGFIVKETWISYRPIISMPFIVALLVLTLYIIIHLKKYVRNIINA